MEFQKNFIKDIYEPHSPDGLRIVRRAILSTARKNGKTTLLAGLALVHLVGPQAIPNGEIYSAANDREQAAQVFKIAAQIVRAEPELAPLLRIVDSTKTILNYRNGSVYKAISSEAGTKHGLNPTVVIFDELAQAKSRQLYDVLDTSMGAREQPLFLTISTQSNDPEHILSKLIDDGLNALDPTTICHLYAVPENCENVFDESVWKEANPALDVFRDLKDFRALAAKAERMPSEESKFRNLYLNQRVSPTSSLIPRREWEACAADVKFNDGEAVYLALDLSSVNDLTALAMVSAEGGTRCKVWTWKPLAMLRQHSDRDFGRGNWLYEEWHRYGHLEATDGKVIDHRAIANKLVELCNTYRVLGCAYDRHKMDYLIRDLDRVDLQAFKEGDKGDGLKIIPWGQGYISMSPAVDAFESAVMTRELRHPNNPVLNWNVTNAVATMDAAGNRKLDKEKARFRIDGAQALVMAVGLKARETAAPEKQYQIMVF